MLSFRYLRLRDSAISRPETVRIQLADADPREHPARVALLFRMLNACTAAALILTIAFIASALAFACMVLDLQQHNRAEWPNAVTPSASFRLIHNAQSPMPVGSDAKVEPMTSSYALYATLCFSENVSRHSNPETVQTIIFFLHGNAGSYRQAVSLICAAALTPQLAAKVYSFDFAQQSNIHRGRLMWQQAAYVVRSIAFVLRSETFRARACAPLSASPCAPLRVWLIGHSMGGAVARLAVDLLANDAAKSDVRIDGVITMNSPNRQPPIFLDFGMVEVYAHLWKGWTGQRDACVPVTQEEKQQEHANEKNSHVQEQGEPKGLHGAGRMGQKAIPLCARGGRGVLLHSITSGPLDLQVEERLSELGPARAAMWRWYPTHHTDDRTVCGRTLSHNDILRDHCALVYALNLIVSHHQNSSEGVVDVASDRVRGGVGSRGHSVLSTLAIWAEYVIVKHTPPCAVAALYIAFVLTAFWPIAQHTLLTLLHERRRAAITVTSTAAEGPNVVRSIRRVSCIVPLTFFLMACGRILLFFAHCFMDMPLWYTNPEIYVEKVTCASVILALVPSLFASVGPSLCGAFATALAGTALRVFVRCLGRLITSGVHVWRRWRQQRRLPSVLTVAPAVYLIAWLVALLGSLQWAERALLWLLLAIVLPVAGNRSGEARFIVTTYALLHALQLMPFFVLRNLYFAHTRDDPAMTNTSSKVPEMLLHLLLLIQIVRDMCLAESMARWRSVRFVGQRYCAAFALLLLALSLMALGAVPIEACRVLWVLYLGFPAFVMGVCLSDADRVNGDGPFSSSEWKGVGRERV